MVSVGGIVLETYRAHGAGPNGGSSKRLADWLEQWRDRDDVKVLVSKDYRHVVAVDVRTLELVLGAAGRTPEGAVRFHPSLPEHSQRLLAALEVPILFDETAPTECPCGCSRAGYARRHRTEGAVG